MSPQPAARGVRRAELLTTDPSSLSEFHRALLGWRDLPTHTGRDCWVGERLAARLRTPRDDEHAGWHLIFGGAAQNSDLTGPDNTTAGLCTGRAQHGPWAPEPRTGELCWTQLLTTATGRADEFWTSTLSWTRHDDDGTIHYHSSGRRIAHRAHPHPQATPGWLCHFAVTDLDTATDRATRLGATLLTHTNHPDVGTSALLTDPHGAQFALTAIPQGWGGTATRPH